MHRNDLAGRRQGVVVDLLTESLLYQYEIVYEKDVLEWRIVNPRITRLNAPRAVAAIAGQESPLVTPSHLAYCRKHCRYSIIEF